MSDLIKREDLVKELNAQFAVGDITRKIANDILNNIPSIEPERKKGEWVVHDYALGRERYECTECKGRCNLEYNFCPHCGSEMTRGKHE